MTSSKSSDYFCNVLTDKELIKINQNFNNNYNNIFVSILGSLDNLDNISKSKLIYVFHEEKLNNDEINKLKKLIHTFDSDDNGN